MPGPVTDMWLELGRCHGDLVGATNPKINTSARFAVIHRGLAHQNLYGQERRGYQRFVLTPAGRAWVEELAAVSIFVRGMRKLPFDF